MSEIKQFEVIEIKDIPPNLSAELARLHGWVSASPERSKWAMEKIDHIHQLLFMGRVFYDEEREK